MSKQAIDLLKQQEEVRESGWNLFVKEYERENPPPAQESIWIQRGMGVGLLAALGLSALLTIPAFEKVLNAAGLDPFFRGIGGFFGFLAVDVVMFLATYFIITTGWRLRMNTDVALENFNGVTRWMQGAAVFGFVVSVASNIYFVFIGYQVVTLDDLGGQVFSFVIAILLALAPPVQAISTGSILALLPITTEVERKRYNARKLASWRQKKAHYGAVDLSSALERLTMPTIHEVHEVHETYEQPQKRGAKRQKVHEYLNEHPEHITMPIKEFAEMLNISTGLASEERQAWYRDR